MYLMNNPKLRLKVKITVKVIISSTDYWKSRNSSSVGPFFPKGSGGKIIRSFIHRNGRILWLCMSKIKWKSTLRFRMIYT